MPKMSRWLSSPRSVLPVHLWVDVIPPGDAVSAPGSWVLADGPEWIVIEASEVGGEHVDVCVFVWVCDDLAKEAFAFARLKEAGDGVVERNQGRWRGKHG